MSDQGMPIGAEPPQGHPSPGPMRAREPGIALCLSGGGYRAMLFHSGALWRLHEAGVLARVQRVSSVSGGSIVAGVLGLHWPRLAQDGAPEAFREHVVAPLWRLAGKTVDLWAVLGGLLVAGGAGARVAAAYRRHLFGDATLQDLPDLPRFVLNASNLQSGVLWRFSKPYMRDYRVGEVRAPRVPLAVAVAASSAFPPFLSPLTLRLAAHDFTPDSGADLQRPPFTTRVRLTDGGVYDNLGLESVWKRYHTVLVSDAGAGISPDPDPPRDWARQAVRALELTDHQVRSLRKRQLVDAYQRGDRQGAYWGIATDLAHYGLADTLRVPREEALALAAVPTRLARMGDGLRGRLINWGYAVCDAAIRRHLDPGIPRPVALPFPEAAP